MKNFFVTSLYAKGNEGHVDAIALPDLIKNNSGEAYHCVFNLEPRDNFNGYKGTMAATFGRLWFDFDGLDAQSHAQKLIVFLLDNGLDQFDIFYSGSKGFHIGLPCNAFALSEGTTLSRQVKGLANYFKKQLGLTTIDTKIYNANRKFRALGSLHPKTGLYKIRLTQLELGLPLDQIKKLAENRGHNGLDFPLTVCDPIASLCKLVPDINAQETMTEIELRNIKKTDGAYAFEHCAFLKHCKDNAKLLSEPEWYAAASIVGRFENGRALFHSISKPHPDYSVDSCDLKLEQAIKASGPRLCSSIAEDFDGCTSCKYFGKIRSPITIVSPDVIPSQANGFYQITQKENGAVQYTPQYDDLLRFFKIETNYFRDAVHSHTYAWQDSHYVLLTADEIKSFAETHMRPKPKKTIRAEFLEKALVNEIKQQRFIEHFFFETTKAKLNLKNGVLDIRTGELLPHSKDMGFRYVLPYDYLPDAECPNFLQFLREVTVDREELQQTLIEFMGYCLWPGYEDHCFLWLSGSGRNGKSTYMDVIQSIVGVDNCTSIMLDQFSDRHYLEMLNHKLVNISEEADAKKIPSEILGTLKALSAGGSIMVDRKYGHPYSMRSTAKLVFAANTLPNLGIAQDAIKSRMIVVPFDLRLENHFTGESKIKGELSELLRSELPGILNLALQALRTMLQKGRVRIHRSTESKDALNEIIRDSDPIERWIQDRARLDASAKSELSTLLHDFKSYCDEGELENSKRFEPSAVWFARALRSKLGDQVRIEREWNSTTQNRTRIVYGISTTSLENF